VKAWATVRELSSGQRRWRHFTRHTSAWRLQSASVVKTRPAQNNPAHTEWLFPRGFFDFPPVPGVAESGRFRRSGALHGWRRGAYALPGVLGLVNFDVAAGEEFRRAGAMAHSDSRRGVRCVRYAVFQRAQRSVGSSSFGIITSATANSRRIMQFAVEAIVIGRPGYFTGISLGPPSSPWITILPGVAFGGGALAACGFGPPKT
jgi:hypothetical protein